MSTYYCYYYYYSYFMVALAVVCFSSTTNCQEPPRKCVNTGPTCIEDCPSNETNWYQWCGSCTDFIRCVNNSKSFIACPSTYVYNDVVKLCTAQTPLCRECLIDTPPPPTDITEPISSTTPAAVPALCESTGSVCVSDCRGTSDGVYQWCGRCDYYLYCKVNVNLYMQCAAGKVWDQRVVGCVTPPSTTCSQCVTSPSTTTPVYDYCASRPCANSAECVADENGYTCRCQPGYTGIICDTVISYCFSEPCLNGGTCYDGIGLFICVCPGHITGIQCEAVVAYDTTWDPAIEVTSQREGTTMGVTTHFMSYTTASTPSTTALTSSNTVSAPSTTPPYAPDIYPDPYITVLMNGTLMASSLITMECSDAFTTEFRRSFQFVLERTKSSIVNGQMCTDTGGTLNIFAGQIQFNFLGNKAQVTFSVLVGVNPSDSLTLRAEESCSSDVFAYLQSFNNWRLPIIPIIFGCPSTSFDPAFFDWQATYWSCF